MGLRVQGFGALKAEGFVAGAVRLFQFLPSLGVMGLGLRVQVLQFNDTFRSNSFVSG